MQLLEVSGAVRPLLWSLGVKGLIPGCLTALQRDDYVANQIAQLYVFYRLKHNICISTH